VLSPLAGAAPAADANGDDTMVATIIAATSAVEQSACAAAHEAAGRWRNLVRPPRAGVGGGTTTRAIPPDGQTGMRST
jgi:hypothetical protein